MMKYGMGFSTGKMIITGEHSVVYGHPAVVTTIDRGLSVTVHLKKEQKTQNTSPYEQYILDLFSHQYTVDTKGLYLITESNLPSKSGLGSSAAFAHASVRALLDYFSLSATADEIYQFVLDAEAFVHKNPSGIDPCAVVYGNTHYFQKKQDTLTKRKLSFAQPYTFLAINSGQAAESTGQMVQHVTQLHARTNLSILFSNMGALSENISISLQNGTFSGELLDENQAYLEKIDVVGTKAKKIIAKVRAAGGAAKVTGAGGIAEGSGWILAYAPNIERLQTVVDASGWENFTSTVQ